jgi:hypothetical protein
LRHGGCPHGALGGDAGLLLDRLQGAGFAGVYLQRDTQMQQQYLFNVSYFCAVSCDPVMPYRRVWWVYPLFHWVLRRFLQRGAGRRKTLIQVIRFFVFVNVKAI